MQPHRICTSDGVALHVEQNGNGSPVLFVPGWSLPSGVFVWREGEDPQMFFDPRKPANFTISAR